MSLKQTIQGHWYRLDGTAAHDATLREARTQNLLPSVTTVIKLVANQALDGYKIKEAIKAAWRIPRSPGESDDDYAQRIFEDSKQHSIQAADAGTDIHAQIETYNQSVKDGQPKIHFDMAYEHLCMPWVTHASEHISRIVEAEMVLADADMGVAGTTDLVCIDKRHGLLLADYKSSEVKLDKRTGKKRPGFWPSYIWQLATYAELYRLREKLPEPPRVASYIIDRSEPGLYEKVWSVEEQAWGLAFMKGLIYCWQVNAKYSPKKVEATT